MTIALASLNTRIRQRCDMVGSEFITDTEMFGYISQSYKELYDILVSKFEDYFVADPFEFTVSSGSFSQALPSDFYKMIGLDVSLGANEYQTVLPFNFLDRNKRSNTNGLFGIYTSVRYRIHGNTIKFTPELQASGSYRLWYIPVATDKTLSTDTIDGVNGWEEYIVVDACIKALTKEESDAQVFMAQKMALIKRIEEMAHNRDAGSSLVVTDVSSLDFEDVVYRGW